MVYTNPLVLLQSHFVLLLLVVVFLTITNDTWLLRYPWYDSRNVPNKVNYMYSLEIHEKEDKTSTFLLIDDLSHSDRVHEDLKSLPSRVISDLNNPFQGSSCTLNSSLFILDIFVSSVPPVTSETIFTLFMSCIPRSEWETCGNHNHGPMT